MGVFDELVISCDVCKDRVSWQSKAGDPTMRIFTPGDCTPEIAGDLNGETTRCETCGEIYQVEAFTIVRTRRVQ